MKPSEAAVILTKISAYDRRTVGDADAEAWAEALDGQVTIQDALTAVRDHFRESREWLMPADVIKRAKAIRSRRINDAGTPDYPPGLTWDQERAWLQEWHRALDKTGNPSPAVAQLSADRALGITRVEASYPPPEEVKAKLAALLDASKSITR